MKIISCMNSDHNDTILEINYKKKLQRNTNTDAKQHATKKPMDHRWNQRGNQKISKDKWKQKYHNLKPISSAQLLSHVWLFATPWSVAHQLLCPSPAPDLVQTHDHQVSDAIQTFHLLSSPFPPAFTLFQHRDHFQGVSSLHQMAKVLEFQLQHQSFQ